MPEMPDACALCMLSAAQAEVSAVNSERERIRSNASQAEQRTAALESELEAAKQVMRQLPYRMQCL